MTAIRAALYRLHGCSLALALVAAASLMIVSAPASADDACDLYAAPPAQGGNDSHPGTREQPVASPFVLLAKLAAGQTGCLKDGALFSLGRGEAVTSAAGEPGRPKTLRPETPGQRATLSAASGFWFRPASHDITLVDLDLRRSDRTGGGSLLLLDGDRLVLDGVDISYAYNICVDIGDDARAGAVDTSDDIVIRRSRIHDCGSLYGKPEEVNDSGVHGMYVQLTRRLLVEDSYIYRNHNRGVQLYPDADGSVFRNNVLHGNGANLNIGSERSMGIYSENNLFENNILSNSVLSGLTPEGFVGDQSEVHGNFPAPGPGVPEFGNVVERNCITNDAHPDALYGGYGYSHADNIENVDPRYADPGAGNFDLQEGSPCAGKGPRGAAVAPARTVSDGEACPPDRVPPAGFSDVTATDVHAPAIDCVVWWKVAAGTSGSTYTPSGAVTREQMATFLARLLDESGGLLPQTANDHFTDDGASRHQANINRLAEVGIVGGVGGGAYGPSGVVSRAQMASFLVRAYEFRNGNRLPTPPDSFRDDDGSTHELNINKAAAAGFTTGRSAGVYEPAAVVTRAQMASFLARVLERLVDSGLTSPPDRRDP